MTHQLLDIDLDPEEEKVREKALEEKFKPLMEWLKKEAGDLVMRGMSLSRLIYLELLSPLFSRPLQPPCEEPLCDRR